MNKYQIALDRLICNIGVAKSNYIKSGTAEDDMNDIQELVDKATPKKPKVYTDTRNYIDFEGNCSGSYEVNVLECPKCGSYLFDEDDQSKACDYCPHCGQRIDWSEEE